MEINEKRIKLEFDLLCWKNFYDKCHELEDAVQVCDIDESEDEENSIDITERKITYDNFISNKIEELNIEKTLSTDYKEYENYIKTNIYEQSKLTKEIDILNKNIDSTGTLGRIIEVTLVIFLPSILVFGFGWGFGAALISMIILDVISKFLIFDNIINGMTANKRNLEAKKNFAIKSSEYIFKDWLNEIKNNKYNNTISSYRKRYLNIIQENIEPQLMGDINELRKIKNDLRINCPLPEKYQDEFHVNALLSLVLDGRVDTLKEAINLFEEEMFRYEMIRSLDMLNYNLVLLNRNLDKLRYEIDIVSNSINSKLNFMISQNYAINHNLTNINYQTNYLMVDALFD